VTTETGPAHVQLKSGFPDRTEADICLWTPKKLNSEDLARTIEVAKCLVKPWGAEKITSVILEADREMLQEA
jgi:hypothetical protein